MHLKRMKFVLKSCVIFFLFLQVYSSFVGDNWLKFVHLGVDIASSKLRLLQKSIERELKLMLNFKTS